MRELPEIVVWWFFTCVILLFVPWSLRLLLFRPLTSPHIPSAFLPRKFTLADLFVLVLYLQVAGGAYWAISGSIPFSPRIQLLLVLATVQFVWWSITLGWINAAGITRGRDRIWFLAVVSPIGFVAAQLILPLITLSIPAILFGFVGSFYLGGTHGELLLIFIFVGAGTAIVIGGLKFTRAESTRIVARRQASLSDHGGERT